MGGYGVLIGAVSALGWIAYAFNRLVRHANLVREAWSGIDVQLKRRHDLVPNLVETVKSHASYEKGVLEDVVRLRGQGRATQASPELEERENSLTSSLRSVLVVAEAYPELRADRSFLDLQEQLVEIENHLQMARRYYNGTVRDYNIAVESFPSNLVARLFGYDLGLFFQVESATERQTPAVELR
jgi:LemA protein